jgi:D-alanyl-D-alanine carboxypeptidase
VTIRLVTLGVVLLVSTARYAGGQPKSPARSWFAWVDSLVTEQARVLGLPGVAVTVVENGGVLLERGYGQRDVRRADASVVVNTPFNIASMTKIFTATVVTQLAREGRLELDAPVRRYEPSLPPQYASLTIRQLLTHTSGIARDLRRSNEDDPDEADYRARLLVSQPAAAPGARFEYSNTGYTVLGWVIEAIEGIPLHRVLRNRIFEPLRLDQASYREPLGAARAMPHNVVGGAPQSVAYVTGGHGSGGMALSVSDLARYAVALQRHRLLDSAWQDTTWVGGRLNTGDAAWTTQFGDSATYGFGWFVSRYRGRRAITHGGGINGYSSMLLHLPAERLTIGVIGNARAPVEPIVRAIADRCLQQGCIVRGATRP